MLTIGQPGLLAYIHAGTGCLTHRGLNPLKREKKMLHRNNWSAELRKWNSMSCRKYAKQTHLHIFGYFALFYFCLVREKDKEQDGPLKPIPTLTMGNTFLGVVSVWLGVGWGPNWPVQPSNPEVVIAAVCHTWGSTGLSSRAPQQPGTYTVVHSSSQHLEISPLVAYLQDKEVVNRLDWLRKGIRPFLEVVFNDGYKSWWLNRTFIRRLYDI